MIAAYAGSVMLNRAAAASTALRVEERTRRPSSAARTVRGSYPVSAAIRSEAQRRSAWLMRTGVKVGAVEVNAVEHTVS